MQNREDMIQNVIQAHRDVMRTQFSGALQVWIDIDISMAQMKTLMVLVDEGPLSIGEVADMLRVSLPTASHLVDRLVKSGLVCRAEDPDDRRRAVARLSAEGEQLLRTLRQGNYSVIHAWLENLSDEELTALDIGLGALRRVATAAVTEDAPPRGSARGAQCADALPSASESTGFMMDD